MSRNRREATFQRNMGNVLSPGGHRSRVEIIDDEDDEVEEISSGFTAAPTDRASRLRTRRQRREATQELQFSNEDGIDEEWEQIQQAIMMSKIEAERQEERRQMCGTLCDVMNLQVEIKPLNPNVLKSLATEATRTTEGKERDDREDTASPVLFSTPPEEQEQSSNRKLPNEATKNIDSDVELPSSPSLPVTMRSPDAVPDNMDGNVRDDSTTVGARQENRGTRKKLSLRRTRVEESNLVEHDDKIFDDRPKSTMLEINEEELPTKQSKDSEDSVQGEKRKLEQNDHDTTDDEDIPVTRRTSLKRKRLSVFEETSDTDDHKEVEEKGSKRLPDNVSDPQPKRIAVEESDQEDTLDDRSTVKGMEPGLESRHKKTSPGLLHVRLARRYNKPRCRPTTMKEAIKAKLYFASPGFDVAAYTLLIIRMFEKYRYHLRVTQSKVQTRIPWGNPVSCGKTQGKTLDAQLHGKASTSLVGKSSAFVRGTPRTAKSTDVKTQLEQERSYRRRTLRSSANLLSQTAASTTTSTATHETLPPCKVDSDSDDGDLMTSYLDKVMPSSLNASTKKTPREVECDDTSSKMFTGTSKTPNAPSEMVRTSSHSNKGVTDNNKTSKLQSQFISSVTETSASNGSGTSDMLFGANVVLDSNMSEIRSNVTNFSDEMSGKDKQESIKSNANEKTCDGETSMTKDEESVEANVDTDGNLSDFIQRPKCKNTLQPLDDDSTDDESGQSQPVFSLHPLTKDASVDYEMSSSKEESNIKLNSFVGHGRDAATSDDVTPLDSQSVVTQSESQGILGKSILETMAKEGETLLPSQALSDVESTSHKLITDTIEETSTRGSLSSSVRPTAKQKTEKLSRDEQFTIDVDSDDGLHVPLKRSEAAGKAASAAMRRSQLMKRGGEPREADSSSVATNKLEVITEAVREVSPVQCPLCYQEFSAKEIEAHASDCQGPPSSLQPSYSHSQRIEPHVSSSPSCAKPKSSIYQKITGQRGELKHLKVVLQRSPLAEEKLRHKTIQLADSAKRNLDFEKSLRPSRSLDQYVRPLASSSRSFDQGSRTHGRNNRAALRTESESECSGYENEKEAESAEVYSWLHSSSPEKKKKPHLTYGGNTWKRCDDYIPLDTPQEGENDGGFTRKSSTQLDRKEPSSKTETIGSDSVASDDDSVMVQYGSQRSSRRKTEPRQSKTTAMDENELALEQLGGRGKKRPLSLSKSSKAKKSRRMSDSGSEDSDDVTIVCHLCNKKIPKELYEQHAEEELEERKRRGSALQKKEEGNAWKRCDDYIPLNTPRESDGGFTRKSSTHLDRKESSSRTETIESDSEASDDDSLMVQYGSQRFSRRKTEPRQSKTTAMDENELALELLGGRSKKRLEKEEGVVTVTDKKKENSKVEQRRLPKRVKAQEDQPPQSSGTEHRDTDETEHGIDWDSISDSPIKCFQFTGDSTSGVDFDNQFEHLKQAKGGWRRGNQGRYERGKSGPRRGLGQSNPRGGYGEFGNRGNYRGSYKKVYGRGRGKKYGGKSRGHRGKK